MIIGIPKEIKNNEYRVAADPQGVWAIVHAGNTVYVETGAGLGSGYSDDDYRDVGAEILDSGAEIYKTCEFIYKVKEILPEEYDLLRENQIVFTYIHSNAHRDETDLLLKKNITGIAYEDITDDNGEFPLLKPMSIIAGKGGFIAGMTYMQTIQGGMGMLLADIPGVAKPTVTIIGAGNSGLGACEMAAGVGCDVKILDTNFRRLEYVRQIMPNNVDTLYSTPANLVNCLKNTNLLMNCILWPKYRTDHLITRKMLSLLPDGAMIVDVASDEGGAIETCRSTSHDHPIYKVDGVTHYSVDNIPSAYANTATQTLAAVTVPMVIKMTKKGVEQAMREDPNLRKGLTCYRGQLTLEETGLKQKREYTTPEAVLGME